MARARALLASGALFRDDRDRVLLVEPSYKDLWEIPGGVVDVGETPYETCVREISEELGLELRPGRLLVVDYCRRPYVPTEGIRFLFDGGWLDARTERSIRLPADELLAHRFATLDEAADLVAPDLHRRLVVAVTGSKAESTAYLEDGVAVAGG